MRPTAWPTVTILRLMPASWNLVPLPDPPKLVTAAPVYDLRVAYHASCAAAQHHTDKDSYVICMCHEARGGAFHYASCASKCALQKQHPRVVFAVRKKAHI